MYYYVKILLDFSFYSLFLSKKFIVASMHFLAMSNNKQMLYIFRIQS